AMIRIFETMSEGGDQGLVEIICRIGAGHSVDCNKATKVRLVGQHFMNRRQPFGTEMGENGHRLADHERLRFKLCDKNRKCGARIRSKTIECQVSAHLALVVVTGK